MHRDGGGRWTLGLSGQLTVSSGAVRDLSLKMRVESKEAYCCVGLFTHANTHIYTTHVQHTHSQA